MRVVVAYVALHSRQSSRSLPDASPGRYSSGRPHRGQSGSRSSRIRSATWSSDRRRPPARCGRVGTGPSRRSASSRRATSASLHPSPPSLEACSASSSSGVRMSRPAFARRRGDARRRRTSPSGVSRGHMAWRACASAPRSTTSRSGGACRTPSAPMRPIRWSRSRPFRYAASSARRRRRSTSGRPALCVVDRRLAVATMAARSSCSTTRRNRPAHSSMPARGARSWARTARARTSTMRRSPLTAAAAGGSTFDTATAGPRSAGVASTTLSSPSDGTTSST